MYPAFFKEIVTLDKKRDAGIKVTPVSGFSFAKNESVLPALVDELSALAGEYPVVFTDHEVPVMVALVGYGRNNFIDETGNWRDGSYLPMTVRTYPFAGLDDAEGNMVFCIDRTYPGIGNRGGEKIFADREGNLTPFGLNAANFVSLYVSSLKKTFEFTRRLKELDLFLPANVAVTKEGQQYNFSGLNQINFQKLSQLSHVDLIGLIDSQQLYYIYLHQFSLNNFSKII